jgi:PAS domain-containing protein
LGQVLEAAPVGLCVFDHEHKLVTHNRLVGTMLNLPEELLATKDVTLETLVRFRAQRGEFGAGDVEEIVQSWLVERLQPTVHTYDRLRPNGMALEVRVVPLSDGGWIFYFSDTTQRRSRVAAAERRERLLHAAFDALGKPMALFDPQDRLLFCNEPYRQLHADVRKLIVPGVQFEALIRAGAAVGQYVDAIGRVDAWVGERLAAHGRNTVTIERMTSGRIFNVVERTLPDGNVVTCWIDLADLMPAAASEQGPA